MLFSNLSDTGPAAPFWRSRQVRSIRWKPGTTSLGTSSQVSVAPLSSPKITEVPIGRLVRPAVSLAEVKSVVLPAARMT